MDKKEVHKLLIEYITNTIQKEDYIRLMDLLVCSADDAELYLFMKQVWDAQEVAQPFTELQSEMLYKRITNDERFYTKSPIPHKSVNIPLRSYKKWYAIAAAAVLIISLSSALLFYTQHRATGNSSFLAQQDVAPGGNKAILTLANGRSIVLTDALQGELAREEGISITKTSDGKIVYKVANLKKDSLCVPIRYNTIRTPAGGEFQIDLPDGTRVWLNSLSSITFPSTFNSLKRREIALSGEAYFEVKHQEKQPFVVKTQSQQVEVLGTHFNINSYPTEPGTKTTLLQGSVRIVGRDQEKEEVTLKPGYEATLTSTHFVVDKADIETAVAWKNGNFVFKDEEFASIARKIERWYDVEMIFPQSISKVHFEGSISRLRNLSELLRKFESTGNIYFKIEGRRITVMP